MSFNKLPGPVKMPNRMLAITGAGVIALGVGAGVEAVHSLNDDARSLVAGVGHAISSVLSAGKPKEVAVGDVLTALEDVSIPSYTPVVEADVIGSGSLDTFRTFPVFGGKIPGTTDGVNLTQTGTAAIMAPKDAITKRNVYELPGSTSSDPKLAVTLTVDADTLYPAMLDPSTPIDKHHDVAVNNRDGFLPKTKYLFFGGSPDGKYTALLTDVVDDYLKVDCAEAMVPLVPAGFQEHFYADVQQTKLTPAQSLKSDAPAVAQALQEIGNGTIPVTVKMVNNEGLAVNPENYSLKDAGYLMSKKAIAQAIGASPEDTDFSFSSQCLSDPKAVKQQVAIQESYLAHTGAPVAVAVGHQG